MSKYNVEHKMFGYEIQNINISKEEEFKIRKMINSNNSRNDITIKFDQYGNVCEKYDSIIIPEINVRGAASRKLYMIFVENEGKFSVVFKTVFYDYYNNPILTSYEIGKMN